MIGSAPSHRATSPAARARPSDVAAAVRSTAITLTVVLVVLLVVVVALGLVWTRVLDDTALAARDTEVVERLVERRTEAQDRLAAGVNLLADTIPVTVLLAVLAVVAWRVTRGWVAPLFVLAAVLGEKLVYLLASLSVGRDRPPVPTLGHVNATSSYPSGHVGAALTLYGAAALLLLATGRGPRWLRVVALPVAVLVAVGVAWARVYRGVHYPSDVVVGFALGAIWLVVTYRALLLRRGELEADARARRETGEARDPDEPLARREQVTSP